MNFQSEIVLTNTKEIRWGSQIESLINSLNPEKEITSDSITLIWGNVNFFGTLLSARSIFFPEETLVKDRKLQQVILLGKIDAKQHEFIVKEINGIIGDPTGHLELANLSSFNWIHEEVKVSSNFIATSSILKILINQTHY